MSYTQKVTTEILCFVLSKRQTGCSNSSRCTFIRRKEPFLTFFTSSCKYKAETKHHQVMTTTPTWGNNYMGCRATNLEHRPFVWQLRNIVLLLVKCSLRLSESIFLQIGSTIFTESLFTSEHNFQCVIGVVMFVSAFLSC